MPGQEHLWMSLLEVTYFQLLLTFIQARIFHNPLIQMLNPAIAVLYPHQHGQNQSPDNSPRRRRAA